MKKLMEDFFLFHLFIYSSRVRCACVDVCMLRHACEARANLQEFSPSRPVVSGGWSQGIRACQQVPVPADTVSLPGLSFIGDYFTPGVQSQTIFLLYSCS